MADGVSGSGLRALPSVQLLVERAHAVASLGGLPQPMLVAAIRAELVRLRADLLDGRLSAVPQTDAILAAIEAAQIRANRANLRRVLNATGIIIHTNLGRAPLPQAAIAAVAEHASFACNLEFDLHTGRRGPRGGAVEQLLCQLTGAQAAVSVNNNAAAMLLALSALAGNGEVIVSRGELVEIGGGFRIPDIIAQGGARLVEVGTTNKTRISDYEAAITPRTRMLLKVHQSNFRIVGFTAEASLAELAGLARAHGLILMDDLGSGTLTSLPAHLAPLEPTVAESLAAGSDIVAFSGDKLLGGPQAGLLAGRTDLIDRLRRHPLLRALRTDKLTLAALEATLRLHADPATAAAEIPVLRRLAQTEATLQARAETLCAKLAGVCQADIVPTTGHVGGGALPGQAIPSRAVAVDVAGLSPDDLALALRTGTPAIAARIHDGRLLLDMLTLDDAGDLAEIADALAHIAA